MTLVSLLPRLREKEGALTRTEARIADYLFNHQVDAAFLPAAQIAELVGVSESSILRFAKSVGYLNYHELQTEVQTEIRRRLKDRAPERLERAVMAGEGEANHLAKAFETDVLNLQESLHQNTDAEFSAFVASLQGARRVYPLGMRGAGAVATLLGYTLNLLLEDVRLLTGHADDLPDQLLDLGERDVLLACAFSRHAKRTMQAVGLAKRRGATILALTDDPLSPLAMNAHHSLVVAMRSRAFIQSYTAAFSVVHGLLAALGAGSEDFAMRRLRLLEDHLGEFDIFFAASSGPPAGGLAPGE